MAADMSGGPPQAAGRRGLVARLLRYRIWLYAGIVLVILAFRVLPGLRSRMPSLGTLENNPTLLVLTGNDQAPALIPVLGNQYRDLYPSIDLRIRGGGSRQALEDLINHRANLAFLNRRPSPEENQIIRSVADSVECLPVALGGVAVLSALQEGVDSVGVEDLRSWLLDRPAAGRPRPNRFYVPDPNTGLWGSIGAQLGLADTAPSDLVYLADETAVARAVAVDPLALGFASTLSLPPDLDRLGARLVRVSSGAGSAAVLPGPREIAEGRYPLFHYLYISFLPDAGSVASGFVTFMYSGLGQRLVQREGFLPARQVARTVQLVEKPQS